MNSSNDHDYVVRRRMAALPLFEDETSSDAFEPPEPASRPRLRLRLQRLGNTDRDHDYLAADAGDNAPIDTNTEEAVRVTDAVELFTENQEPENNPPNPGPAALPPEMPETAGTSAAAAGANQVDLTASPSPAKKRKRLSRVTPKSNTPKIKRCTGDGSGVDDADEDDGLTCPICLDTWEMSGEHRLVSLRCGHLFGAACITRWLNESARQSGIRACPQCKAKATNKDIRHLYAKRLRAIDRSEEHALRELLDEERRKSLTLHTELATITMSHSLLKLKTQTLEADNERMKLLLRNSGGYSYTSDLSADPKLLLQSYKLHMERNLDISREPGCRVMSYADHQSALVVSQRSAQGLFPGFGLRFIDVPTFRLSNFLHVSAKQLRDLCLSADGGQLAVASQETRVKLFDLRTRQVSSSFMPPGDKSLWACAMDRNDREHFLYLGAHHGSTFIYDVRFPETVVEEFKTEGDLSPVINVAPVPAGRQFTCGGFLVCKLKSLWFFEYSAASGSATATRLNVDGPFISMNYSATNESLLVSARSCTTYPQSRYLLGRLDKVDTTPVFDVAVTFFGSKATPVMTRCSQIAVESNTLVAGYIQDAKTLSLFDARRKQRQQSLPVQELVYDTCPVYTGNSTYLAALTDTRCRIYKLMATSSSS